MKLFSSFCKFKLSKQFKLSNLIKHHKSSFTEKANTSEKENNSYSDTLKFMFESNILNKKLPCFEIYSSQVEILTQPMDFYLAIIVNIDVILKKLIKQAKERICISSLYLGTGKIEQFLVDELLKALQRKPNLKVTILLDHQRGLRLEKGENSLTMLSKIITEVIKLI